MTALEMPRLTSGMSKLAQAVTKSTTPKLASAKTLVYSRVSAKLSTLLEKVLMPNNTVLEIRRVYLFPLLFLRLTGEPLFLANYPRNSLRRAL